MYATLSVAVFAICVFAANAAPSASPSLPPQFSVVIEANVLPYNQTLNLREWTDRVNKLSRYEITSMTGVSSYIVNWDTNQVWTVKDLKSCSVAQFNLAEDPFGYLPNGYLGLEALSRFNTTLGDTYLGQQLVRGVPCDGWRSTWNSTSMPGNQTGVTSQMTIEFWFSTPSWGTQFTSTNVSHPMRASVNGTRTDPDGTTHYVNNDYGFIGFVPAAPVPAVFMLPDECLPVQEALLRYVLTNQAGAGLVAGMFFLGLLIGIIIWTFVCIGYRKYQEKKARRYGAMKTPLNNDTFDNPMGQENL